MQPGLQERQGQDGFRAGGQGADMLHMLLVWDGAPDYGPAFIPPPSTFASPVRSNPCTYAALLPLLKRDFSPSHVFPLPCFYPLLVCRNCTPWPPSLGPAAGHPLSSPSSPISWMGLWTCASCPGQHSTATFNSFPPTYARLI